MGAPRALTRVREYVGYCARLASIGGPIRRVRAGAYAIRRRAGARSQRGRRRSGGVGSAATASKGSSSSDLDDHALCRRGNRHGRRRHSRNRRWRLARATCPLALHVLSTNAHVPVRMRVDHVSALSMRHQPATGGERHGHRRLGRVRAVRGGADVPGGHAASDLRTVRSADRCTGARACRLCRMRHVSGVSGGAGVAHLLHGVSLRDDIER